MINFFKRHANLSAFLMYVVLTLIMTIPVVLNINNKIPGAHDNIQALSKIYPIENDFNKLTTLTDKIKFFITSPLKLLDFQYYWLLIHKIIGEPLAYNLIWLSSFLLSAFGGYLLANLFIKNKKISFISGIIYSFAPFHFGFAMAFSGAIHIEFIVFYLYFLFKFIFTKIIRSFLLALIFLAFTLTSEPHFAAYITIFTLFILLYYLIFFKNKILNKKILLSFIGLGLAIIFYLITFAHGLFKISLSNNNWLKPVIGEVIKYSADPLALFTPGILHPIWGNYFKEHVANNFTGNFFEWSIYIGYVVLFFVIIAIIKIRKSKQILFWLSSFVFFFILSLGPYLHFGGELKYKIPLPYLLIYKYVPFLENIRSVSRIYILCLISLSILAGLGIKYFSKNLAKNNLVFIIVTLFILIEFWSVPFTSSVNIPEFFKQLSRDEENYKILEPQVSHKQAAASISDYYNKAHQHPIVGKFVYARERQNFALFEKNTPIINNALYYIPQNKGSFIEHGYDIDLGNFIFSKNNIKYILFYKKYIRKNDLKVIDYLKKRLNIKLALNTKDLLVYEISNSNNIEYNNLILQKNKGWSNKFYLNIDQFVEDSQSNSASLNIKNYTNEKKAVKINMFIEGNKIKPINIKAKYKDQEYSYVLPEGFGYLELKFDNILKGNNIINIKTDHNKFSSHIFNYSEIASNIISKQDDYEYFYGNVNMIAKGRKVIANKLSNKSGITTYLATPHKNITLEADISFMKWDRGLADFYMNFIHDSKGILSKSGAYSKNYFFISNNNVNYFYNNKINTFNLKGIKPHGYNKFVLTKNNNNLQFTINDIEIFNTTYADSLIYGYTIGAKTCCNNSKIIFEAKNIQYHTND